MKNLLQDKLLEPTKEWISSNFGEPMEVIDYFSPNDRSVIYLYLREKSILKNASPFTNVAIAGKLWDILYVGESDNFKIVISSIGIKFKLVRTITL